MNMKYKTIPCRYYPNCDKGKYCTFLHDDDYDINKIKNIEEINNNEKYEGKQKNHPFTLFVKEINNFIEIYKKKEYIKYELSENFWEKELKYFKNLNHYLENINLEKNSQNLKNDKKDIG